MFGFCGGVQSKDAISCGQGPVDLLLGKMFTLPSMQGSGERYRSNPYLLIFPSNLKAGQLVAIECVEQVCKKPVQVVVEL